MEIKRFLCPDDDEEESYEVVITRKEFVRYQMMESLLGSSILNDIDRLMNELPYIVKIFLEGRRDMDINKCSICISERLRLCFTTTEQSFPYPYFDFKLGDEWKECYLWHVYDEDEILSNLSAVETIKMIHDDSDEEKLYNDVIEGYKEYIAKGKKSSYGRRKYKISNIDFNEFMEIGMARGRHIRIINIPTLGWARFVFRCISERGICLYPRRIAKTKNGYRVITYGPSLLTGRRKIYKFYWYYADKLGLKVRDLMRCRYDKKEQEIHQMAACEFMYDIYRYIDEHGEDSDEDIAAWLETAKRY